MMKDRTGQEHVVKKSKFTEEQIAFALKQAELVTKAQVCLLYPVSQEAPPGGESFCT